jgi:hypothetical protein
MKKRFWLTHRGLYEPLDDEFGFDFDPCPFPRPPDWDALASHAEWGQSNYVNPPFCKEDCLGGFGLSAWAKKAVAEQQKGKTSVLMLPTKNHIDMLLEAGAEVRHAGRIRWLEADTHEPWSNPTPAAIFVLRGKNNK